jgi:hypothetical protein
MTSLLLSHRHERSACHGTAINKQRTIYPDLSDISARKAQGRREAARRPWGEKIAIMEAMRERPAPLRAAREAAAAKRRVRNQSRPSKA